MSLRTIGTSLIVVGALPLLFGLGWYCYLHYSVGSIGPTRNMRTHSVPVTTSNPYNPYVPYAPGPPRYSTNSYVEVDGFKLRKLQAAELALQGFGPIALYLVAIGFAFVLLGIGALARKKREPGNDAHEDSVNKHQPVDYRAFVEGLRHQTESPGPREVRGRS